LSYFNFGSHLYGHEAIFIIENWKEVVASAMEHIAVDMMVREAQGCQLFYTKTLSDVVSLINSQGKLPP
jgi:hypothetical protein